MSKGKSTFFVYEKVSPKNCKTLSIASPKFLSPVNFYSRAIPALLTCFLFANVVYGKETFFLPDDEYLQTIWTTEDGLPQNSINDILQSRDGYLWLATFGGLVRFDGVKFTTFNSGNTPGLMSNRILSLYEGQNGTIWMGTQTGEIMTLDRDGPAKTYRSDGDVPITNIVQIIQAEDGTVWGATYANLVRFEGGKLSVYGRQNGFPADHVRKIEKTDDNSLWFLTEIGLVQLKDGAFNIFNPAGGLLPSTNLLSSNKAKNILWVQTSSGLEGFSGETFTKYAPLGSLTNKNIAAFFEAEDGALWIHEYDHNIIYKLRDGVATVVPINEKRVLRRVMFLDNEGNVWIGTDGNGLIQLKKRKLLSYSTANGLPSDFIRAVTGSGNGVWVSTDLGISHLEGGVIKNYSQKDGMPTANSTALCMGRDGTLWIGGSNDGGLSGFKDGRFTSYPSGDGPIRGISALYEDREGDLWIGTPAALLKMRDGKFTSFQLSDGLVSNSISFITQTTDGAMWFATVGGLSRLKNGRFSNYTTEQGLSINYVRDIFEEPNGTLWFGTYGGGLNRLKEGKITVITMRDGLFDDFISRLLSDEKGNLWMLSNRGIFRVNLSELNSFADGQVKAFNFLSFTVADGMLSSEGNGGNQPSGWRTADGKLWFPTIKGVAMIDAMLDIDDLSPPVIIEKITIDRKEWPPAEKIEIDTYQENIEIEYTGINFSSPEQVKFKYRLLGLDTNWVEAGTRRTAYFSHLPPGEFTFEVIAASGDGPSAPTAAALKLVVHPPFWRTWWFLLICLSFLGLGIAAAFRIRIAKLQRARILQQEFSRHLINANEIERRRIAAELHDGLGHSLAMIKNSAVAVAETKNVPPSAQQQLEQISEQTAQAISEVREISYNLRPYLLDYLGLTKAIQSLFDRMSAATIIEIEAEVDDINGLFDKEEEISIYRIIQECLNNILNHANANKITVAVRKHDDLLSITINDDGKGFDQVASTVNGRSGGFGLLGITERVRMLGGVHAIKSRPGNGTTITVSIGFNKKRERRVND